MENLPKEYLLLFNTLTDLERALQILRQQILTAQRTAEELYIRDEASEGEEPGQKAS